MDFNSPTIDLTSNCDIHRFSSPPPAQEHIYILKNLRGYMLSGAVHEHLSDISAVSDIQHAV